MDEERTVRIDVETATETATRQEDVDRIRREAGLEQGDPPPRGEPSGEDSEVGRARPRGSDADGDHDHSIDRALASAGPDEASQHPDVPQGASRDDEVPS